MTIFYLLFLSSKWRLKKFPPFLFNRLSSRILKNKYPSPNPPFQACVQTPPPLPSGKIAKLFPYTISDGESQTPRLEWWTALPGHPFFHGKVVFLTAPTFLHITRSRRVNQSMCERKGVNFFFLSNKRWGCLPAFGTGGPYQSSVKKNSTIYLDYYARRVWGQVNFRKGFWYRYWGRAGQLLANVSTVPSHRPRSLCERHSRNEKETEPS